MKKTILYKTINLAEVSVYIYWAAMSFGYAVLDPLSLSLMLFILLIMQFYAVDQITKEEIKNKITSLSGNISKIVTLFMWFIMIIGYLEFWWFLITYYLFIMIYIFVRRKDLLKD